MRTETFEAGQLAGVSGDSLPKVERVKRHANSSWTMYFRLNGEVELPDGRRVVINRRVAARATEQLGRRPRRMLA